jgi:hypothetical protein
MTNKATGKSENNCRSFDFAQDDTVLVCEEDRNGGLRRWLDFVLILGEDGFGD